MAAILHATRNGDLRVRVRVRGLRGSDYLARHLQSRLSRFDDMSLAAVSPVTGHVLIEHARDSAEAIRARVEDAVWAELMAALLYGIREPEAELGAPQLAGAPPAGAWHAQPPAAVAQSLGVDPLTGLGRAEAAARRRRYGANVRPPLPQPSALALLAEQLTNVPTAALSVAAVLAFVTGGAADAALIGAVLATNVAIGYLTESRSARVIDQGAGPVTDLATVRRGGQVVTISATELVPGDVVVVTAGPVAADLRLAEASGLGVDESPLTGESLPVDKAPAALPAAAPMADRRNMLYQGTVVISGSGLGLVVATGPHTEAGRIRALTAATKPPETPLQKRLRVMCLETVVLSCAACAGVMIIGLRRGIGWRPMLEMSISLAIAAVPEGLPTVGTATLALGVARLARDSVLVRRLAAVENLGSVSVVCFDKTGTVTTNTMRVEAVWTADRRFSGVDLESLGARRPRLRGAAEGTRVLEALVKACALCNDAELKERDREAEGSATELALLRLARQLGIDIGALRRAQPRLGSRYRTEAASHMATLHRGAGGRVFLAVKGQPDEVLGLCSRVAMEAGEAPLGEGARAAIREANQQLAGRALRVLGVAYAEMPAAPPRGAATLEGEPVLCGVAPGTDMSGDTATLSGLAPAGAPAGAEAPWRGAPGAASLSLGAPAGAEAPWRGAPGAASLSLGASGGGEPGAAPGRGALGAAPSGDAPDIGSANLTWLGLVAMRDPPRAGVGQTLAAFRRAGIAMTMITGDQLSTATAIGRELGLGRELRVFARVSPTKKLEVIQDLQRAGHIVAMAGDGVNDSPALRAADIGIAMGAGAPVARDAAEVVLADNDLGELFAAIRQGRTIRENLGKAIHFLLATNLSEMLLAAGGMAIAGVSPLNPRHLLWINLLTDVVPALALALDPPGPGVMQAPPRDPDRPMFDGGEWRRMGGAAAIMAAGAAGAHVAVAGRSPRAGATAAFLALSLSQLLYTSTARIAHERAAGVDHAGDQAAPLPPNPLVTGTVAAGLALQALTITAPPLRALLGNVPLAAGEVAVAAVGGIVPFLLTRGMARHAAPPLAYAGAAAAGPPPAGFLGKRIYLGTTIGARRSALQ